MEENKVIAFTGKGGVGKTTCLVLFLKYLLETKKGKKILVIDADPDANLGDVIGVKVNFRDTIAGKMKQIREDMERNMLPAQMTKRQVIENELFNMIIKKDGFDMIEMGRTEGEGCYCSINNVLKNAIDIISKTYDYTLIDSPAGLEFFARKSARDVSDLIIVVDPSKMAFHSVERILEVTKEVSLEFGHKWLLGNRFTDNLKNLLDERLTSLEGNHVQFLGAIPEDSEIRRVNLLGGNLLELDKSNETFQQCRDLFSKVV